MGGRLHGMACGTTQNELIPLSRPTADDCRLAPSYPCRSLAKRGSEPEPRVLRGALSNRRSCNSSSGTGGSNPASSSAGGRAIEILLRCGAGPMVRTPFPPAGSHANFRIRTLLGRRFRFSFFLEAGLEVRTRPHWSGPRFFGFGPTLIRPKPVRRVLPEPGAMKRPHHIDRVDPDARPAPRAAAFVEREARWDDTATKIKRGEARLDAGPVSHFERRIAMLARVWQKTLVASVRTSSVTSDNAPLRL